MAQGTMLCMRIVNLACRCTCAIVDGFDITNTKDEHTRNQTYVHVYINELAYHNAITIICDIIAKTTTYIHILILTF